MKCESIYTYLTSISVVCNSTLCDIDAHLHLELLVPEFTLGLLNHFNVPADKMSQLRLEVTKVLCVLRDQVSIAILPLEWRLSPLIVLRNLLHQLGRSLNPLISAHAEAGDVDHGPGVNLIE